MQHWQLKNLVVGLNYDATRVQNSSLGSTFILSAGPNLLPWISVEFWRRTILPSASPFLFSENLSYQLRFDYCYSELST